MTTENRQHDFTPEELRDRSMLLAAYAAALKNAADDLEKLGGSVTLRHGITEGSQISRGIRWLGNFSVDASSRVAMLKMTPGRGGATRG